MERKGQAAMEFLMTYGWAILAALVAISALVGFGVIDVGNITPEKCIMGPGFSCNDYQLSKWVEADAVESGEITLMLQNNLGKAVVIQQGGFTYQCHTNCEEGYCDCGTNTACPVINWQEVGNEGRPNDPTWDPLVWRAGDVIKVEANPGTYGQIRFSNVGGRARCDFEITYIPLNEDFPHTVSGEVYAEVYEQS